MSSNGNLENSALVPINRQARTVQIIQPQTMGELMLVATHLANSCFIPAAFRNKPDDVMAAIQYGAEIGMPAMQALRSICVINGKPSIYGDAMLAIVRASGLLEDFEEGCDYDPQGKLIGGWARCIRRGYRPASEQFTMHDAQLAGLAGKEGPWKQYPQRMCKLRARAFLLRDQFGDVLNGMQMAEEMMDFIDITPDKTLDEPRASANPAPFPSNQAVSAQTEAIQQLQPAQPPSLSREQKEAGRRFRDTCAQFGLPHATFSEMRANLPSGQGFDEMKTALAHLWTVADYESAIAWLYTTYGQAVDNTDPFTETKDATGAPEIAAIGPETDTEARNAAWSRLISTPNFNADIDSAPSCRTALSTLLGRKIARMSELTAEDFDQARQALIAKNSERTAPSTLVDVPEAAPVPAMAAGH